MIIAKQADQSGRPVLCFTYQPAFIVSSALQNLVKPQSQRFFFHSDNNIFLIV